MAGQYVRARLREKDRDIRAKLNQLIAQGQDESDIVRAALRMYFDHHGVQAGSIPDAPPRMERPQLKVPQIRKAPEKITEDSRIDALLGQFLGGSYE